MPLSGHGQVRELLAEAMIYILAAFEQPSPIKEVAKKKKVNIEYKKRLIE